MKEEVKKKEDHVKHVQNESQERQRTLQHAEKENTRLTQEIKELLDKLEKETRGHEATSCNLQKNHAVEQEKTDSQNNNEKLQQEVQALQKQVLTDATAIEIGCCKLTKKSSLPLTLKSRLKL